MSDDTLGASKRKLIGIAVDIGRHAPGTPIILDTKATTQKLRESHHYSIVKTYIYEKDQNAW